MSILIQYKQHVHFFAKNTHLYITCPFFAIFWTRFKNMGKKAAFFNMRTKYAIDLT